MLKSLAITFGLIPALISIYLFDAVPTQAPLRIAVIDTGLDLQKIDVPICRGGHDNFSSDPTKAIGTDVPPDTVGHGTNMVEIIMSELEGLDRSLYCFQIIKWYPISTPFVTRTSVFRSFNAATRWRADVVNFSTQIFGVSHAEVATMRGLLDSGAKMAMASCNNMIDIDKGTNGGMHLGTYDSRVVVVGAVDSDGNRVTEFCYGKRIDAYEDAQRFNSRGTSVATAIFTGKLVRKMVISRMKGNNK